MLHICVFLDAMIFHSKDSLFTGTKCTPRTPGLQLIGG
ncbi:hypothetical protein BLAT2472_140078 [Burkholderia latens]